MDAVVEFVCTHLPPTRALVAIDGVDGSGKTTFAADLAARITQRPVILIHVDDFLNPTSTRHARGRRSPEGFWLDSYNYRALDEYVLESLSPRGNGRYRAASYDPATDSIIRPPAASAPQDAIVLIEGMFLHRGELADRWDLSLFLDVPFAETARRMAARDGSHPDPEDPSMRRYVEGQRIYLRTARPWEHASLVIDNRLREPRTIPATAASATVAAP